MRGTRAGGAAALAGAALALVSATAAHAATASYRENCVPRIGCSPTLTIAAAPGERNAMTLAPGPDGGVLITDAGAPLRGCTPAAAGAILCPGGEARSFVPQVELGDGDDTVDVATGLPFAVEVHAGTGDDIVTGGAGNDTLTAGPGRDVLHGGAGDDELIDGGPAAEADTFDGGADGDGVSYAGRRGAVVVDLRGARAGSTGERDRLLAIEGATGGRGADRLTGDGGENVLRGGPGGDVVHGRGGIDLLWGDAGADRLDAGAGDDQLDVGPGADRARCGPGRDAVTEGGARDLLDRCERAELAGVDDPDVFFAIAPPRTLRSPIARLSELFCLDVRCRGRIWATDPRGTPLGRTDLRAGADRAVRRAPLRLSPPARRRLARAGTLRVTLRYAILPAGQDEHGAVSIVVRRP